MRARITLLSPAPLLFWSLAAAAAPPAPADSATLAPGVASATFAHGAVSATAAHAASATVAHGSALRSLRDDPAAEQDYQRCTPLLLDDDPQPARSCLQQVQRQHPGTVAALRAGTALVNHEARVAAAAAQAPWIAPGRLELSSVAGLFGIWNGLALGLIATTELLSWPDWSKILGTGGLALGLGAAYSFAGYQLAEALQLGEGDSKLVASGLVWGSNYGGALAAILLDQLRLDERRSMQLLLATVVASGFVGGGAALALTGPSELDSAQVSMVNTGGWIGAYTGALSLTVLGEWGVRSATLMSLSYMGFGTAGLVAGAALSQWLRLSWGESLLCDLGAVLGSVLAGTLAFSLNAAELFTDLQPGWRATLLSGSLATGALVGWAATTAGMALWRQVRGDRLWRITGLPFAPTLGVVQLVQDDHRQPLLLWPLLAGRW